MYDFASNDDLARTRSSVSYDAGHSRSQQRTDQRVLVITLKFLALKETGFPPVKNTSQKSFDFILCNFLVRTTQYFHKKFKFIFCL
jgi:hypothetical protein